MSKKRVTTETVMTDKEGNRVTTSVTQKQGVGCLGWLLLAPLVVLAVMWPTVVLHGWVRWLGAAAWWVFLLGVVCVRAAKAEEKKGQNKPAST